MVSYSAACVPATEASWVMEQDDKYRNLPAHNPTLDEALDRLAYLKGKGFKARALALVATPTETAAKFESAKIQPPE